MWRRALWWSFALVAWKKGAGSSLVEENELLSRYIKEHSMSTASAVALAQGDPCSQRYVSADFWGRGLGNSVNVALNALALAVATNRTLLLADDNKFRAGFWKYLGAPEKRWASKDEVLRAWKSVGGCERCGGCLDGSPDVVRNFFPMRLECLKKGTCGDGVRWLLCDDALSAQDSRNVHVRAAVTWLAPLLRENDHVDVFVRKRLDHLFWPKKQYNAWGGLYEMLLGATQPLLDPAHPLTSLLETRLGTKFFDVGVHVRHRRHQPLEMIERESANCVAEGIKLAKKHDGVVRVFVATELPSRLDSLYAAMRRASSSTIEFISLNVTSLPGGTRGRLQKMARTDAQAMRAGRDWGELASERWASVADFLLLARSRVLVGALSSTFSELAGAVIQGSATLLYDPIWDYKTMELRTQHNWPHDQEYLNRSSSCFRADRDWPLPQYIRLTPNQVRAWKKNNNGAAACAAANNDNKITVQTPPKSMHAPSIKQPRHGSMRSLGRPRDHN